MPKFANEEHAKEYMDINRQYREISRDNASTQRDFHAALKQVRINQIVEKELNNMPSIPLFKSSGKMFISSNKPELLNDIKESDEILSKEVVQLERKLQTLEEHRKTVENRLESIVEKYAIKE